MQLCKNCLNASIQAFPLAFENGVCNSCVNQSLDTPRQLSLDNLVAKLKRGGSRDRYDCLVPVFGDREDWYTVSTLLAKNVRVLVTWVNSYFNGELAWKNFQNLITELDVDSINFNPNLVTYRKMVQKAFVDHQHVLLPYQMLKYSFAMHTALENRIRNIVVPYHQAKVIAGTFPPWVDVEGNKWSTTEYDFSGVDPMAMCTSGSHIKSSDINEYIYPEDEEISGKVVVNYLSNFVPWIPQTFGTENTQQCVGDPNIPSADTFYRAGCKVYYGAHDLLRYNKFGYVKARDHLASSVRFGYETRSSALEQLQGYTQAGRNTSAFYEIFDMSKSGKKWMEDQYFDPIRRRIDSEITDLHCAENRETFLFKKAINI